MSASASGFLIIKSIILCNAEISSKPPTYTHDKGEKEVTVYEREIGEKTLVAAETK
jgi:hypothetical protein